MRSCWPFVLSSMPSPQKTAGMRRSRELVRRSTNSVFHTGNASETLKQNSW